LKPLTIGLARRLATVGTDVEVYQEVRLRLLMTAGKANP
jgi:hypothetical protein